MNVRGRRLLLPAALLVVPICACVSQQPIKLYVELPQTENDVALLWVEGSTNLSESLFSRWSLAIVTKVDGIKIEPGNPYYAIVEFLPGIHRVEVTSYREGYICGWGGCKWIRQGAGTVDIPVVAGHSYEPQTWNACGRNWLWIEDRGKLLQDDIKCAASTWCIRQKSTRRNVVAGEMPPQTCDAHK